MALSQRTIEENWQAIPINASMEQEFFTEAEYFAFEETAFGRWEFVPVEASLSGAEGLGIMRAMSGGTAPHSEIAGNFIGGLRAALRASGNRLCHVYTSDLKVHCPHGQNTYPDLSVVCGKPIYYAGRRSVVTNPILLGEVLSPSTEAKDRSSKWESYRAISTLQHYLLISAVEPHIEVFTRVGNKEWQVQFVDNLEADIVLPALGVTVAMTDIYDLVDLSETE